MWWPRSQPQIPRMGIRSAGTGHRPVPNFLFLKVPGNVVRGLQADLEDPQEVLDQWKSLKQRGYDEGADTYKQIRLSVETSH